MTIISLALFRLNTGTLRTWDTCKLVAFFFSLFFNSTVPHTRSYIDSTLTVGTIPTEYGRLSTVLQFYLDSNSLTGTLPTELGNMYSVQQL